MTYLDTHVAVWLYTGHFGAFSAAVTTEIESADLLISPIVLLEVLYLKEIGRINFGPDELLAALKSDISLKVCPLPFHQIVTAAFAEDWTRDVFDRVIVAQAKATASRLISKDGKIQTHYARALW